MQTVPLMRWVQGRNGSLIGFSSSGNVYTIRRAGSRHELARASSSLPRLVLGLYRVRTRAKHRALVDSVGRWW